MCGIFGAFHFGCGAPSPGVLDAMAQAIGHRGPDATGCYDDDDVALGNRRLSILDLSSASNQPLSSDDGLTVVVQNGEIYNFVELRDELREAGRRFDTTGDTEVLLRAYEHWGPDFVTRLNGMFAIAIYDQRQRTLRLYRDRLGVKPLYIAGGDGERLWFASEIKAILATGFEVKPNLSAFAQYFALNYVPQPETVFAGIRHLPPGCMAEISATAGVVISRYWDLAEVRVRTDMSEVEARDGILALLDDATRIRMRSDAPFGAFLSGGLDSSTVVGFMSRHAREPVRSYSIGFDDPRFDETEHALAAARLFGTEHRTERMSNDGVDLWPRFIWHCDQPHGDISFIPTDQVSSLAARDVKMVLTGDGGDELFAGYEKYLDVFPQGDTAHLKAGWEEGFVRDSGLLSDGQAYSLLAGPLRDVYRDGRPHAALTDEILRADHQDPINRVLMAETLTLLPGNNLVKPDRMAMANSLEVRSPFLDYRLAEFAFSIPGEMKLRGGQTKAILKDAVEPMLGRALTRRTKQMFTVPVGEWFRQKLAGYCRETLLDGRLAARGLVSEEAVSAMLQAHIAGTGNYTRQLRALISLEIWHRLFVDRDPLWLAQARAGTTARPMTAAE
jgi:asparagine synthase (glutamine-hydrolysing)